MTSTGEAPFVVVMGVSGSGKSTIALGLADALGGTFLEGDDFHTDAAKAKMGAGIALTDADRWPWLDALVAAARVEVDRGCTPVLSCSALKRAYRDHLFRDFAQHRLVYLRGSFELIKRRMDERDHEYMRSTLLESQFATLEEPDAGPNVCTLPISDPPDAIIAAALGWLRTRSTPGEDTPG